MTNFARRLRTGWTKDGVTIAILLPLTFLAYGKFVPLSPQAVFSGFLGLLCGFAYWHPFRGLGFVPFCYSFAAAVLLVSPGLQNGRVLVVIASAPLGFAYQRLASHLSRDPATRILGRMLIGMSLFALFFTQIATFAPGDDEVSDRNRLWFGVVIAFLAAFAWLRLFRPAFELACEPFLWIMYKVERLARGTPASPMRGPCIVIANHACWLDPLFLAKVLPRPITPMMTSKHYDRRWLRPLLKFFHTIRVPDLHFKRQETPDEIRDAIAALDRGDCLVLFPEGFLQRSEDKPLRRFGRGVWQILTARPNTPVYCCWIEGGWGSYTSYFNGKPTKNKRPDLRRHIGVVVPEPISVDAAMLSHHLTTRIFLMNRVLESRKMLGLPELAPFELPKDEEE